MGSKALEAVLGCAMAGMHASGRSSGKFASAKGAVYVHTLASELNKYIKYVTLHKKKEKKEKKKKEQGLSSLH